MQTVKKIFDSIASFGKVLLLSGRPSKSEGRKNERIIIMGNGPSLNETIAAHREILKKSKNLAVNFAALTPEFCELKPSLYVLADAGFFTPDNEGKPAHPKIPELWKHLSAVDWKMALYIPCKAKIPGFIEKNANIEIKRYNLTPAEGLLTPVHWLYRRGLAMPRPRNVLIASIMIALREGYRDIYIVGADHTWSRELWVDDENHVISVQRHFYKENDKEFERVKKQYEGYHLHDILNSLTIAFRSYHQIAEYAETIGARIINATPGSFIDAFPRGNL